VGQPDEMNVHPGRAVARRNTRRTLCCRALWVCALGGVTVSSNFKGSAQFMNEKEKIEKVIAEAFIDLYNLYNREIGTAFFEPLLATDAKRRRLTRKIH